MDGKPQQLDEELRRRIREYQYPEENEPYLGPAWAVLMAILYFLKEAFPAEHYTFLWWLQIYILALVIAITIFIIYRRRKFFRTERERDKWERENDWIE